MKKLINNIQSPHKEAFLFCFSALLLFFFLRLGLLISYGSDLSINWSILANIFIMGLRFDLKIIAYFLICFCYLFYPVFWLLKINWYLNFIRVSLFFSFIFLAFLSFLEAGYYVIFSRPIDISIFGIIEDGFFTVFKMFLKEPRAVIIFLAFFIVFFVFFYLGTKAWKKRQFRSILSSKKYFIISYLFAITILVFFARGSFFGHALSRGRGLVHKTLFFNYITSNPALHLHYAIKDKKNGLFKKSASEFLNSHKVSYKQLLNLSGCKFDKCLAVSSKKTDDFQKPHIIFVLMEGWSSHIALKNSKNNNVLGEFSKHAKEDYFFPYFFSNTYSTNSSIENLLLNSPISPISQSKARGTSFKTSNVKTFKENKYNTLFLSGGSPSWRQHLEFWPSQGFDDYVGRTQIDKAVGRDSKNSYWGSYDEDVFTYLKRRLLDSDANKKKLFSLVLTTNNHDPVSLPASYIGYSVNPKAYGLKSTNQRIKKILKGYQYQTDSLGKFLSWLKSSPLKDKVILVATGDHIRRNFYKYTKNSDLFFKYAVPAYFYLPNKYRSKFKALSKLTVGSHSDLFPTLFELSLSKKKYYKFGTLFMDKKKNHSFGWNKKNVFLFDKGVVHNKSGLYKWKNKKKTKLNSEAVLTPKLYKKIIKNNFYKNILKQYLLIKNYENQKNNIKKPILE